MYPTNLIEEEQERQEVLEWQSTRDEIDWWLGMAEEKYQEELRKNKERSCETKQ